MSTPAPKRRSRNFVRAHWRGELPLWASYWIIGFVGNIASIFVVAALSVLIDRSWYQPFLIFGALFGMWACVVVVAVWQVVGIWRSATYHAASRSAVGRSAFWAYAAKAAVVLGVLRALAVFISSGLPQMSEVTKIAFLGDPDIPGYSLRVVPGGTELEISGGIKYGLTNDISQTLEVTPGVKVIHLDSVGGRLGEAERLAEAIRQRRLTTYVSNSCASACTIAFVAGAERWLLRGATLGFHRGVFAGVDNVAASFGERRAYHAAGIDPSFIDKALSVSNEDIWYPTDDELSHARVVTNFSSGDDFAISGFGALVSRDTLASHLSQIFPLVEQIKRLSPEQFSQIADAFYDAYQSGKTTTQAVAAVNALSIPMARSYLAMASDSAAVELGYLIIDVYNTLAYPDPRLCYEYAIGEDDPAINARLPDAIWQREQDVYLHVLQDAVPRERVASEELDRLWNEVLSQAAASVGAEAMRLLLNREARTPDEYSQACNAVTLIYQLVVHRDERDAAIMLRADYEK